MARAVIFGYVRFVAGADIRKIERDLTYISDHKATIFLKMTVALSD
jgi:hypothetical protein